MRSGLLAGIRWSVCMLKSHWSLCESFSRTGAVLCIYHLFVWSNWNFLHISLWITLPTQSCLTLYSFCANLLHSLIMWLIVSSLSPHSLHLLFCCILSILALIWLVLSCAAYSLWRVFHACTNWSLSESKCPQVSQALLCIRADLNNAAVWMVSTHLFISKSSSLCTNPLVTILNIAITIAITVTFMFHSFFFSSLARSWCLSFSSLSFNFTPWSAGTARSTIWQVLFFFLTISRFGCLAKIRWSVCSTKSLRSLCISFSRMDSGLTGPLALWVECSPMVWVTGVQSQVKSYLRLKKWYLMLPCLTLGIIR